MSESDDDKRLSNLVREHGPAVEKAAELEKGINALSETLASLAHGMRIEMRAPKDAARVTAALAQLPAGGISADQIRAMLAEYAAVNGKLASIRSQLAPFGFRL